MSYIFLEATTAIHLYAENCNPGPSRSPLKSHFGYLLQKFRQSSLQEPHASTNMCSLGRHGNVFVLKFLGETEHRFTPQLCSDVLEALKTVNESDARALVTTNEGKFYSNGLDLEWMKEQPDTRFPFLVTQLERIIVSLMKLNMPTIAALCGHAAAGGLLLAMAHDYRYMRKDRGFLYNSAVDINVVVPSGFLALLKSKLTPQVYRDVVLKGVKYTGIKGHEAGLIDSLQDGPDQTVEAAMKEASVLAVKPWEKAVYQGLRIAMYSDVIEKLQLDVNQGLAVEDMLKEL